MLKMLAMTGLQFKIRDSVETMPLTIQQPTTDVTAWDTYNSPDDDIHAIVLKALTDAPDGTVITSSQYGFTDQDIADQFARLGKHTASRFLFDKTQEGGPHEKPIVQELIKSLQPNQWAIGTSKKAHAILHTKAIVLSYFPIGSAGVSYTPPQWTVTGSFNLSASAQNQFNIVDITSSPSRGLLFRRMIEEMFDWVKTNEPTNQP